MASHGILFNHTTANKNEYLNPCIPMGYRCYRDIYLVDCISKNGRLQVLVLCEVRISFAQVATFHYDCYPKDTLSSAGECCAAKHYCLPITLQAGLRSRLMVDRHRQALRVAVHYTRKVVCHGILRAKNRSEQHTL